MNVGFLGLGRMGRGMAHRLLGVVHDLIVYDVMPAATESLVAAGARAATAVADACAERDVIVTMLVEDAIVLDVALSAHGIRDSLPKGAIHLAMGTYGVDAMRTLGRAHAAAGHDLVAAPVLGRPDLAAQGQLGIVAAGRPDAIDRCRPLLDRLGRRVFRAGDAPTAATAIKLANNHLLGCALVSMAEGFSLARKYGATPQQFYDLFTTAGFNARAYSGYGKTMVEEDYDTVGSPITVGLKDALLIRAAAEHAGVPMPSHNVYRDRLLGAVAHGDGARDQAVLAREQNRAAGIEPTMPVVVMSEPSTAIAAMTPFMRSLGATRFPEGASPEQAAALALAHTALVVCAAQAMAEAFALVRKYDVDPRVMHDVMTDGLFSGSDVYKKYGAALLDGATGAGEMSVARVLELLALVTHAANRARVPLPSLDACRDRLLGASAHGDGGRDWTTLYREQARASGL